MRTLLCACGCGGTVYAKRTRTKYLRGHYEASPAAKISAAKGGRQRARAETPEAIDTRMDCTCLGTCNGADRLGPRWRCALEPRKRAAQTPERRA